MPSVQWSYRRILNHFQYDKRRGFASLIPQFFVRNENIYTHPKKCIRLLSTGGKGIIDPTAKRPNKKCDPYGLAGKPLSFHEVQNQLTLLDPGWRIHKEIEEQEGTNFPMYLEKDFFHLNYLDGSRFISKLAAVAHMNNHFFVIKLERRLSKRKKNWEVVSTIRCHTEVLGGLSFHDFHIAMLIDVEVSRDDAKSLLIANDHELRKKD